MLSLIHLHLVWTGDRPTDDSNDINMNTDMMSDLTVTSTDTVIASLSPTPTLFDVDSLTADICADNGLTLEADDVLPDLSSLEDFVDLTEFFVSSAVFIQHLVSFVFRDFKCVIVRYSSNTTKNIAETIECVGSV